MKTFQIEPANSRKSFYNKCRVIDSENIFTLQSYETNVATFNKSTKKLSITKNPEYLSNTTLTHINGFLSFLELPLMNKKDILNSI